MLHLDDTIAAIATPPGEGGIGVVRLSGPRAVEIAARLFETRRGLDLKTVPSHTLHHGHLIHGGQLLDEVLVAVMRAPHSYTRQDVVELQTHGSPVTLRRVLEAALACGARLAGPGEFTQWAFLNGRLSLDQAQAVLDVIRAKTALSASYALDRLAGKLTQPLERAREALIELLAGVGVGLDYPEYEQDALPRTQLLQRLSEVGEGLAGVLSRARDGRLLREGTVVAIVGRPNVGKSTLLNALLDADRALVSPVPGTTRDTLEEHLDLQGVPLRLIDTAGLRQSADEVEQLGIARARAALARADLALVVLDLTQPLHDEDHEVLALTAPHPRIVVLNKTDAPGAPPPEWLCGRLRLPSGEALALSAQTGAGLPALKDALVRRVWGGLPRHEDAYFLDLRQRELLQRAAALLAQASATATGGGGLDLVAAEVQDALEALGELTGHSASEAVIERIFATFCVGK